MKKRINEKEIIALVLMGILVISAGYYFIAKQKTANVDMLNLGVEPKYPITFEEVNYFDGSEGFYAHPEQSGNYPGVVMIHEWWGLNDNIKEMARHLASQGYNVLAVDLYNGQVAEDSDKARELSSSVRENPAEAIENMKSAKIFLESQNSGKIASLGWCFGGQQSLQLSLNEEVDATVIYYGNLVTDTRELAKLNGPVLGIFGSEDDSIPVSDVNKFDAYLDSLAIENDINIYPGVGHAFANPSGENYAKEETMDAWMKTLNFLNENLN
jgi:carboxymethylenebutenolidase